MTKAFGAGDVVDGRTLSSIIMGTEGLSDNQVAFYATFTNGTKGIFVATVPEPATVELALCGIGLCMLGARLRRQS